jgi:hypothetical protein
LSINGAIFWLLLIACLFYFRVFSHSSIWRVSVQFSMFRPLGSRWVLTYIIITSPLCKAFFSYF